MMLALLALPLMAQQQFTLEDLNFGGKNYRQMIPQSRSLKWWGDQLVRPSADTCWTVDVAKGKEKVLFTRAKLNKRAGLDADTMQVARLSGVSFPYADQPLVMASNRNERLLINFKTGKVEWRQPIVGAAQAVEWNKESRAVAYVKGDNLYVTDAAGNTRQVTEDGSRDLVYGQSVHRNEFGIEGGLFWNPQGSRLAFYRMDQSMVTDYPLITVPELDDSTHVIATPAPEKYPMAGQTSHLVTVGVLDVATGDTVYLKAGDQIQTIIVQRGVAGVEEATVKQVSEGPDGKRYITGGEVPIRMKTGSTPEETIRNMEQVQRAAHSPADPSGQDMRVAAKAAAIESRARAQAARKEDSESAEHPAKVAEGTPVFAAVNQEDEHTDPSKNGVASVLAAVKEYQIQSLIPAA